MSCDSPDVQPTMRNRGITLAQLHQFAEDCRQSVQEKQLLDPREFLDREKRVVNPRHNLLLDFDTAPMWLVVDLFVKPATLDRQVPFVDVMAERWPHLGGPRLTTHFVSHSWGQCFVEDLAALEFLGEYAAVWICSFALTQHGSRLELLDNSEVFAEALMAPTTMAQVIVLDQEVTALKRLWVLFEVLRAFECQKRLIVSPPDILTESRLMSSAIQLESADATSATDKAYILREFEKVGLAEVNNRIRETVESALLRCLRETESVYGSDSLQVAKCMLSVGIFYCQQGWMAKSEPMFREVAQTRQAHFGEHHLDVAEAWAWLGSCLSCRGHQEEAKALHERALEVRCALLGSERHEDVAKSLSELGVVHWRMCNRDKAEQAHQRALRIQQALFGEDNLEVAKSYFNLGSVYHDGHNFCQAVTNHQHALDIRLKLLGPDAIEVAQSIGNMAFIHWFRGNYAEAESQFRRALHIHEQQLTSHHPWVAQSCGNLGLVLADEHKLAEAEAMHQRSLEIRLQVFGDEHPDVAKSYGNLGLVLAKQPERLEEALDMHRRALCVRKAHYGHMNPTVARSYLNLGSTFALQGNMDLAQQAAEQALDILDAVGPHFYTDIGKCHMLIGDAQSEAGHLYEADVSYGRAWKAIHQEVLCGGGREHYLWTLSEKRKRIKAAIKRNEAEHKFCLNPMETSRALFALAARFAWA